MNDNKYYFKKLKLERNVKLLSRMSFKNMDFNFIDSNLRDIYINLSKIIQELKLWNALKSDACFDNSQLMENIFQKVKDYDNRSTSCVVIYSKVLLDLHYIANHGYDDFEIKYTTKHC